MAVAAEYVAKLALVNILFALAELSSAGKDPYEKIALAKQHIKLAAIDLALVAPGFFERESFIETDNPEAAE
jgi:hypothetical protein